MKYSQRNANIKIVLVSNIFCDCKFSLIIIYQIKSDVVFACLRIHWYVLVPWHTVPLIIWHHLFLKFWLVDTWFFAHWPHQGAVTRLENVHQLNVSWDKNLGFQLSQKHPHGVSSVICKSYFGYVILDKSKNLIKVLWCNA